MEQFSLDKWLKDKSRQVVTRRGNPVRIVCTDRKHDKYDLPIIFLEETNDGEVLWSCKSSGMHDNYGSQQTRYDLFFADEEMELTEFEKKLKFLCSAFQYVDSSSDDVINGVIQDYAKDLLDLARKEIEKDYCIMEPFDVSDLKKEQRELGEAIGRTNVLKDMPKWKKITKKEQQYLAYGFLSWDGYYLSVDELKQKLPKEE